MSEEDPMQQGDRVFAHAQSASEKLMSVREDARARAVNAIRGLEVKLREAIAGDTIRGLSSLVGDHRGSFQAIRVHGRSAYGIDEYLPEDGRWALVITKDGVLSLARVLRRSYESRSITDEELNAQDLEPIARAIQTALERHVTRAERTTSGYLQTSDLAQRLARVLGFPV